MVGRDAVRCDVVWGAAQRRVEWHCDVTGLARCSIEGCGAHVRRGVAQGDAAMCAEGRWYAARCGEGGGTWSGMRRSGVARCGVPRCGMTWCGEARYGAGWCGVVRCGMV